MVLVLCSPGGDCLQVGGYDVDPGYPSAGAWPGGWNVSTAGIYTANISLSLVPLSGSGSWSVQVINGWTSSGIVDYDMDLQFPGLCPLATDVPVARMLRPATTMRTPPLRRLLPRRRPRYLWGLRRTPATGSATTRACGAGACGAGTWWDDNAGLCRSLLLTCPGDIDFNGSVNVTDVLDVLGQFGVDCGGRTPLRRPAQPALL